jgi:serine protease Do
MKRLLLPAFLGCCSFLGGMLAMTLRGPQPTYAQTATPAPSPNRDWTRLGERFELVARQVSPTVVSVEATKPNLKAGRGKAVEESGSGVLIRVSGQTGTFVLTNNHVVQQADPAKITISLADGRIPRVARVWADPESDVALLKLESSDNLPAAQLGDSDSARVGQWVLAFGSPFGLNQTVTHGIISARERGQVSLGSTIRIKDFLQTDAAINPGSSGGPLVNLEGEVIGVNTAIASYSASNSGVAFSIPINLVKRVVKQLLEKGSVARGYLGLQVAQTFEAPDAVRLGLDRAQGALVETVYPDTPAATAGLKSGDVVLQIDDVPIRNENHFINLISGLPAGQKVRLQVWRERRSMLLEAIVGDWAKGQERFRTKP